MSFERVVGIRPTLSAISDELSAYEKLLDQKGLKTDEKYEQLLREYWTARYEADSLMEKLPSFNFKSHMLYTSAIERSERRYSA